MKDDTTILRGYYQLILFISCYLTLREKDVSQSLIPDKMSDLFCRSYIHTIILIGSIKQLSFYMGQFFAVPLLLWTLKKLVLILIYFIIKN